MNAINTFCEKCRDIVEYTVKEESKNKIIKGININYTGKEAYCNDCNNLVFVNNIRDFNLSQIEENYNKVK
jgi:hypothetical protein